MRTGLSAQVAFFVDEKHDVTRVPLGAVRWSDGEPYVAVPRKSGKGFDWRGVKLGLQGSGVAEVLDGLSPGDSIIALPDALLPAPAAPPRPRRPVVAENAPAKAG